MRHGSSAPCATFGTAGNLVDGGPQESKFDIVNFEIWGFDCNETVRKNIGANIIQTAWRTRDF
jgi:hypothetical protein